MFGRWRVGVLVALAACGGARANDRHSSNEHLKESSRANAESAREPLAFAKNESGTGDAITPYVRPERSSRLDGTLRAGRPREAFRGSFRESLRPAFVLATGNRVAVLGSASFVTFDRQGHEVDQGNVDPAIARFDRASGKVVAADGEDVPPGEVRQRYALHDGAFATAAMRMVKVTPKAGEPKVLEGDFEGLEVAFDDEGIAQFVVRQKNDLMLWSVPSGAGSIGRTKLGVAGGVGLRAPPIVGRSLRVFVLADRMVAVGLDGKRKWERKGAVTGGATITGDDVLLVADAGRILAVDPTGKATELVAEKDLVFVTPPILDASGLLVVASGKTLHAYAFP